jgi:hypothetical protein
MGRAAPMVAQPAYLDLYIPLFSFFDFHLLFTRTIH